MGTYFLIDCGIDDYETTYDYCDYLDSIEFIQNSLSDPKWTSYNQVIRNWLGSQNLSVYLNFW